jgi:hypothetical protein
LTQGHREVRLAAFAALLLLSVPAFSSPLAVQASHSRLSGANLITNPGFESALLGWSTSAGTAVYYEDSTTSVSGCCSAKGVETSLGSLGRLYQNVTSITSPGSQYQISGWIKTENATGAVVIALDYIGIGGWTPGDGYVMEIGHASGTQNWTFYQSSVFTLPPMPSDAQALWFLFDFNNGLGTAWFDDVSLTCVSCSTGPGPTPPVEFGVAPGDGEVSLYWTTPALGVIADPSVTGYNLYRGPHSGPMALLGSFTGGGEVAYKDASVSNGVSYCYKVTALYGAVEGQPTPTKCETPHAFGDSLFVIEASDYTSSSIPYPRNPIISVARDGDFLGFTFTVPVTKDYTIMVYAKDDSPPPVKVSVTLDGNPVGTLSFPSGDNEFHERPFKLSSLPSGSHDIVFTFINDFSVQQGIDRNFYLRWIRIPTVPAAHVGIACASYSVQLSGPNPFIRSASTGCLATVTGNNPTGVVRWTSSGSARFYKAVCSLRLGSCSTIVTATASGKLNITANYAGDPKNAGAMAVRSLLVLPAISQVLVSCPPKDLVAGSPRSMTCSARVMGYRPTGNVSWSQTGGDGSVLLGGSACAIVSGRCTMMITANLSGSAVVRASYGGDSNNLGSYDYAKLTIQPAKTTLSVTCAPSPIAVDSFATCTASLSGFAGTVGNETIIWSTARGPGAVTLGSASCSLSSTGSCSVRLEGTHIGGLTVMAAYAGDQDNVRSSGTCGLKVKLA